MTQADIDVTTLSDWIREYARVIGENAGYLTDLDAAIGDADHGTNMERGMSAVVAALDETPAPDPAALVKKGGRRAAADAGRPLGR